MDKPNRLSKILASAGVASRRACEELIFEGKVTVNGKTIVVPQTFVTLGVDVIAVNGVEVCDASKKLYFILNKPKGYICSSKPMGRKKLVIDLFKTLDARLFTIGRLDRDTTGLILVTNDGHFANRVIHPSANLSKEYLVKVMENVNQNHLTAISKGALVEETFVKPKRVSKLRRGTIKIVVMEGKKREVRRLVEAAGLTILSLTRLRIGGLTLGSLEEGVFRELTEKEREQIFQDASNNAIKGKDNSKFVKRVDERRPSQVYFERDSIIGSYANHKASDLGEGRNPIFQGIWV